MAPPVRRIGRFTLHERLGTGAQATVWRAHDERLDRDVALKLLDPKAGTVAVQQWLHEARAVSRLTHPNIVPVFDADEDGGMAYLVFELVRGRTLAEQLRADGALSPPRAVRLMMAVLDALMAAHALGIVHRDLKPSNILIDDTGRPRVMDFGIAARVNDAGDGRIVGTPGYLSPEAAAGAAPAASMDVFSAGMVLAEMLAGIALVRERDPMVAVQRVREEDFALAASTRCDDTLRALVRRALARDPTQRFATAREFRDALATTLLSDAPQAGTEGHKATLEFLLRRMRLKSDFPALSDAVMRIQRIVGSDTESLGSLSNEILRDVALTNKLLRMVNTAHFSRMGGGTISTVSRAVALVGFAGIRNMALSLVLLEHMSDKAHAARLRDEFVRSLMAGQLASELTPWDTDVEDAYLAAMFQNLGRLLTEFYLPEEAKAISDMCKAPAGKEGPSPHDIEAASEQVLGLGFEALGVGVAKSWGLPDALQRAMRRPQGDPPVKPAERGVERHRWLAALAHDLTSAMQAVDAEQARRRIARLAAHHAQVLGLPVAAILAAVEASRVKLAQLVPAMGMLVPPDTATHRMLSMVLTAPHPTADLAPPDDLAATIVQGRDAEHATAARVAPPPPVLTADLLAAGIQDVMDTLAGDAFQLNAVLRMILETMLRALRLRRVVFCLRDPKTHHLTGRFGLGSEVDKVVHSFDIALSPAAGTPANLFTVVCQKGADTVISDSSDARIRSRLPAWYRGPVAAPSFLLLPMAMKGAPFALIYADAADKAGIVLGERELSLIRTLRNQAVMAFRQAG
ncbi:MAG: HDOD domain-containing protein [Ideonella sp.]|nr:HDOD domain-containing protein [Ideonella sp.]